MRVALKAYAEFSGSCKQQTAPPVFLHKPSEFHEKFSNHLALREFYVSL